LYYDARIHEHQGNDKVHEQCSLNGKIMHESHVPSTKNNIQTKLNTKQSTNIHFPKDRINSLSSYLIFNHAPICS
jgi:hypothetical protein